jgi:hypothetical protein
VSDPNTPAADVIEFVGRGVRAQACVDAAVLGSRVALVRSALQAALDAGESGDYRRREHELRALAELVELALELARHFDRFAR